MKVGGRDFELTKEEVEVRMRGTDPELIQKYVVEVNGQWYPPKQVLGHATGWPRTSFTTMEAQRVLTRIGFVCSEAGAAARLRQAGQMLVNAGLDSAQAAISDYGDVKFQRGFSRAIGISSRRIQAKLDDFRALMKGSGLSQAEQAVYAYLDELKSEIEADCDRYWQGSGVDWRPVKQVAKMATRLAEDTGSEPGALRS